MHESLNRVVIINILSINIFFFKEQSPLINEHQCSYPEEKQTKTKTKHDRNSTTRCLETHNYPAVRRTTILKSQGLYCEGPRCTESP